MKITRLFDVLDEQLKNNPLDRMLTNIKKGNKYESYSTAEVKDKVDALSRGLLKLGVKPNDKVAVVVSNNCKEWNVVDYGIQQIGAVSVPVYSSISPQEYEYIFNQAEVRFCFVSDMDLAKKVLHAKENVPSFEKVYSFTPIEGVSHWEEVLALGEDTDLQKEVEDIKKQIGKDDIATLIYTSGTTGKPKGVMLSHDNILSNSINCGERIPKLPANPRALSFLPICHVYERMLIYLYQNNGVEIYYAQGLDTLGDDMKLAKPHIMTVVPRLIEKVYDKIYHTGVDNGGLKSKIFKWSLDLIKDYTPYEKKPLLWQIQYSIANRIVFKKWREGVGGEIVTMVSGSAKLQEKLIRMFWGARIPIMEGYGLTETSPVIAVTSHDKNNSTIGTVGKPIPHTKVKIADDGEIWVKGPGVFKGYYKSPEQTAEVMTEDGYFMTGDMGALDENGLLKITGRKKQIFKTSGGKYIVPQAIESAMKKVPFIEQIMVVGEGQKMPCALIQPKMDYVKKWAKENSVEVGNTYADLAKNKKLIDEIKKGVTQVNKDFGKWEQIKLFRLTPEEWTVENECLTPTLKHKRKNIKNKFIQLYNEMYGN